MFIHNLRQAVWAISSAERGDRIALSSCLCLSLWGFGTGESVTCMADTVDVLSAMGAQTRTGITKL